MTVYDPSLDSDKMRALMQFAGSLAHPLNSVATSLAAEADMLGRPDVQLYLQSAAALIKHNACRVASIASVLLRFAGQQPVRPQVLSVAAILTNLTPLLRCLIDQSVELTIDCVDNVFSIYADVSQFEQIMCSLVVHGADSMPDGGAVTVRAVNLSRTERPDLGGDHMCVEIANTGAAIPSQLLDRIFEPVLARKSYGLWLGLATVYGAVTQMHGRISVISEPPIGTKFDLMWPAIQNHRQPATTATNDQ